MVIRTIQLSLLHVHVSGEAVEMHCFGHVEHEDTQLRIDAGLLVDLDWCFANE